MSPSESGGMGRVAVCGLLTSSAAAYPWDVTASTALRRAIEFLDLPITAETVVRAGYVLGASVGAVVALLGLFVPGELRLAVMLGAVALGLLACHAVHVTPLLWARARRTRALGAAPDLVARMVLRMRLSPTPERAAAFAAETGEGLLARRLAAHTRKQRHTARTGLVAFGDAWAEWFQALRRSAALLTAAGSAPASDRDRLLDRALGVVMDGVRDEMEAFAARIRAPATALYAFGVLLPTALVALLPAAGAVGVAVTPLSVVVLYNVFLPVALLAAGCWLLVHRPVAFPPPAVTTAHPEIPDRRAVAAATALCTAVVVAALATQITPLWGSVIGAVGVGSGIGLWLLYSPVVALYDRVEAVEASLPDALSLLGRRVANGHAVETAVQEAGSELDDEMGTVLRAASERQRQLKVGVREAFLGEYGPLSRLPSTRVRGSVALLAVAAREGRPAGTALLSLGTHVEELQTIEREARHSLSHVCHTLQTTGTMFAPMVAGATVALAGGISGEAFLDGETASLAYLGAPVGVYVLFLSVFLTVLSTGLIRGFDRALVGYRAGRALCLATVIYLCSYLFVGQLL